MLQEARAHFPALARWASWCYQAPTHLRFGDVHLASSSGVQQGDPIGPLLLAAAIQPLVQELRGGPLDFSIFYLDDGLLVGELDQVAAALAHVQRCSAWLGLSLNLAKSKAVAIGHTSAAAVAGHLPAELVSSVSGANGLRQTSTSWVRLLALGLTLRLMRWDVCSRLMPHWMPLQPFKILKWLCVCCGTVPGSAA